MKTFFATIISSVLLASVSNADCEQKALVAASNAYKKLGSWGKYFENAEGRLIFRRNGVESYYVIVNFSNPFSSQSRGEVAYSVRMTSNDCKVIKLRKF